MANANEQRAAEHRQRAAEHRAAAEESFQRSDTDGFLTQWAHGLHAQREELAAQIERDGGTAEFPALFDLEGNRVAAKLIDTRFGQAWALCDEDGDFTGRFVSAFPKRESTMRRKGFKEGHERVPAKAVIRGVGRGLSGRAWAAMERRDRGFPAGSKVVE